MAKTEPNSPSFKYEMVDLIARHNKKMSKFITSGADDGNEETLKCIAKVISSKTDLTSKDMEGVVYDYAVLGIGGTVMTVAGAAQIIFGATMGSPKHDKITSTIDPNVIIMGGLMAAGGFVVAALNTYVDDHLDLDVDPTVNLVSAASVFLSAFVVGSGYFVPGKIIAGAAALINFVDTAYHIYDNYLTRDNIRNDEIEAFNQIFDEASLLCGNTELSQITCNVQ